MRWDKLTHELFPLTPARGIDLFESLVALRPAVLQQGVSEIVGELGVTTIYRELGQFAPDDALTSLAQLNIRGELVFPTPSILRQRRTLLGYHRMLLGISQKDFQ